jgi:hypothetical protein
MISQSMAFLGSPFNLTHGHNAVTGHTTPIRVKKTPVW